MVLETAVLIRPGHVRAPVLFAQVNEKIVKPARGLTGCIEIIESRLISGLFHGSVVGEERSLSDCGTGRLARNQD